VGDGVGAGDSVGGTTVKIIGCAVGGVLSQADVNSANAMIAAMRFMDEPIIHASDNYH
jgi:hypothetical protein